MATQPPEPTVRWVLLSWQGRLGRQSYFLGAALLLVVQLYIFFLAADANSDDESQMITLGFGVITFWLFSTWAMLAMTIKRLHDVGLPTQAAIGLFVPMINVVMLVVLMTMPGSTNTNEHGPPPFGKE